MSLALKNWPVIALGHDATFSTDVFDVKSCWAAWYIARLLVKLTRQGVVFSFLLSDHAHACGL